MGRRSGTASAIAIMEAFLRERSWTQTSLARVVGLGVPALRKRLEELVGLGLPLTSERDHPDVWWSVPNGWYPGSVLFGAQEIPDLVRQLSRMPRSAARDRLLRRVLEAAPRQTVAAHTPTAVITPATNEEEEAYLGVAEDSAMRRQALHVRYFSANRGTVDWRHASVQRVVVGPPARLIVVCHRSGTLKWFRIGNVLRAHLDPNADYRTAPPGDIDRMLADSLDGFQQGEVAYPCSFLVREPEARWVGRNLPGPMNVETTDAGIRVTTTSAGVLRLARFVVGLGGAARAETPELARLVEELARGALDRDDPQETVGARALLSKAIHPKRSPR